jgi:predicted secreted protein
MTTVLGLILAVTLAAQAPATAAPAAPAPAAKPAEPKKVCVEEAQIGSHFKKRICATPEQWEKRRTQDAAAMAKPGGKAPTCTGVAC